jgi:chromosome segregation ATPase
VLTNWGGAVPQRMELDDAGDAATAPLQAARQSQLDDLAGQLEDSRMEREFLMQQLMQVDEGLGGADGVETAAEVERLTQQLVAMRVELEEHQNGKLALATERDTLLQQLMQVDEGLGDADGVGAAAEVERLTQQMKVMSVEVEELTQQLVAMGEEVEEHQKGKLALATERDTLLQLLADTERAEARFVEDCGTLEQRLAVAGEQETALVAQLQLSQTDQSELLTQVNGLSASVDDLNRGAKAAAQLEEKVMALEEDVQVLLQSNSELEAQLEAVVARAKIGSAARTSSAEGAQAEVERLTQQLVAMGEEVEEHQKGKLALATERDTLLQQLMQVDEGLGDADGVGAAAEVERLTQQMKVMSVEVEELTQQLVAMGEEVEEHQKGKLALATERDTLLQLLADTERVGAAAVAELEMKLHAQAEQLQSTSAAAAAAETRCVQLQSDAEAAARELALGEQLAVTGVEAAEAAAAVVEQLEERVREQAAQLQSTAEAAAAAVTQLEQKDGDVAIAQQERDAIAATLAAMETRAAETAAKLEASERAVETNSASSAKSAKALAAERDRLLELLAAASDKADGLEAAAAAVAQLEERVREQAAQLQSTAEAAEAAEARCVQLQSAAAAVAEAAAGEHTAEWWQAQAQSQALSQAQSQRLELDAAATAHASLAQLGVVTAERDALAAELQQQRRQRDGWEQAVPVDMAAVVEGGSPQTDHDKRRREVAALRALKPVQVCEPHPCSFWGGGGYIG